MMQSISSFYNNNNNNNNSSSSSSIIITNKTHMGSNMILTNNTYTDSNTNDDTTNTTRLEFPRLVKVTLKSIAKAVTTDEPTEAIELPRPTTDVPKLTNQVAPSTKVESSPRHPNMPAPGSETQDILLSVFLACLLDGGIDC